MHFFFLAEGGDPNGLVEWTAAGSIALLLTFGVVWASAKWTLTVTHYGELDSMYSELLKLALEKPYLTKPQLLTKADQKEEYDIYAFMVWNFLETIYDRCKNEKMKETWYPIIDAENRLHRAWFDKKENEHKFKAVFRDFIQYDVFRDSLGPH